MASVPSPVTFCEVSVTPGEPCGRCHEAHGRVPNVCGESAWFYCTTLSLGRLRCAARCTAKRAGTREARAPNGLTPGQRDGQGGHTVDGEASDLDRRGHRAVFAVAPGEGYEEKTRACYVYLYKRRRWDKVDRWILFLSDTSRRPARPGVCLSGGRKPRSVSVSANVRTIYISGPASLTSCACTCGRI